MGGLDGPGIARLNLWGRCGGARGLLVSVVTGVANGLDWKRREEEGKTNLFRLFFFIAFLDGAEHPLCHGLVADAKLNGGVQDGGPEDRVRIPFSRPRTRSVSVH